MTPKTFVAIILIAFGIGAFAYQSVTYMTSGRDVSGSTYATTKREHSVPLAPIVGAIALIGGIAMLLVDKNDFKSRDQRGAARTGGDAGDDFGGNPAPRPGLPDAEQSCLSKLGTVQTTARILLLMTGICFFGYHLAWPC